MFPEELEPRNHTNIKGLRSPIHQYRAMSTKISVAVETFLKMEHENQM